MTRRTPTAASVLAARPGLRALQVAACPPGEREGLVRALGRREAHRAQGRAARASGGALEAFLDEQHQRALGAGLLAWIGHYGPATVTTRCGQHITTRIVGTAPVDYLGCTRTGRAIAVEAKRCSGHLDLTGVERASLAPHQRAQLEATDSAGGLALLVVAYRRRAGDVRYAVPWGVVQHLDRLRPADLAGWELQDTLPGGYLARWIDREDGR